MYFQNGESAADETRREASLLTRQPGDTHLMMSPDKRGRRVTNTIRVVHVPNKAGVPGDRMTRGKWACSCEHMRVQIS